MFTSSQQNKLIDKQIAAQKEENRLNREWNLNLAKMQNQWNIEQWNRENAYNDPSAVMSRNIDAGLNPDLLYSSGAGFTPAASSPEMTAGAASQPTDVSNLSKKRTYGEVINEALQNALVGAQVAKTQSETKKTDKETDNLVVQGKILSADALTQAAKNERTIQIMDSQVYLNHALADESHANKELIAGKTSKLVDEVAQIRQNIAESKARISNMQADIAIRKIQLAFQSKELQGKLDLIASEIKKNNVWCANSTAEIKAKLQVMAAQVLNIQADTNNKQQMLILRDQQIQGLVIDNDMKTFNFDQAKTFDSYERSARITRDFAIGAGQTVNAVMSVVTKGLSRTPKSGNGEYVQRPDYWSDPSRPEMWFGN